MGDQEVDRLTNSDKFLAGCVDNVPFHAIRFLFLNSFEQIHQYLIELSTDV
jgi:hypothetical protein